ncbi:MAG: hypothetical protein CMI01_18345 [Oceanospirillaceae bacterium]|nr:hypothetical protein [Oceanospirillaceae bacterium]
MTAKPNTEALIARPVITEDTWLDEILIESERGRAIATALSLEGGLQELAPRTVASVAYDLIDKFERIDEALKVAMSASNTTKTEGDCIDPINLIVERGIAVGLTLSSKEVADSLNHRLISLIACDLADKFEQISRLAQST